MASLPIFLTCVANSTDDPTFPLLFSWSTPDAQIKEVLVTPDDDWLHESQVETNILDINEEQLYEFGYEATDIIAEWSGELDTDQVIALDVELASDMLDAVFEVKGLSPSFEVLSVEEWFANHGVEYQDALQSLPQEYTLELLPPDEQIAALLNLAYSHQLIQLDDIEEPEE